jgi:hypothetical protein
MHGHMPGLDTHTNPKAGRTWEQTQCKKKTMVLHIKVRLHRHNRVCAHRLGQVESVAKQKHVPSTDIDT